MVHNCIVATSQAARDDDLLFATFSSSVPSGLTRSDAEGGGRERGAPAAARIAAVGAAGPGNTTGTGPVDICQPDRRGDGGTAHRTSRRTGSPSIATAVFAPGTVRSNRDYYTTVNIRDRGRNRPTRQYQNDRSIVCDVLIKRTDRGRILPHELRLTFRPNVPRYRYKLARKYQNDRSIVLRRDSDYVVDRGETPRTCSVSAHVWRARWCLRDRRRDHHCSV